MREIPFIHEISYASETHEPCGLIGGSNIRLGTLRRHRRLLGIIYYTADLSTKDYLNLRRRG